MLSTRRMTAFRARTCGLVSAAILQAVVLLPQMRGQTIEATVHLDSLQQVISGFGAANILPWRPDMTAGEIQKAFGIEPGQLGFTILRLRVPYQESEFALNVPTAQAAYAMGVKIIASPWTPPPSMKTSNNIVGGELYDTSYASYAAHLKSFADYMSSNGVPLYAISVQNEPDVTVTYESCDWDAAQMLKFVKENGPAVGVPIIAPESFHFDHALSDPFLNDSTAAAHVAIVGGHIYGGGLVSYPLAASKGKELWMTEHLDTDTSWAAVLATGQEIHDCLNVGMNAYIWWYIVRFYGPIGEDGNVTKRGYVMSQFSSFIRPGFTRVYTTYTRGSASVSAYKKGSKVVIVAVNGSSASVDQTFSIDGFTGAFESVTPYVTSKTKNCEQQSDIAVASGIFTTTLPDSSITTFVGNVVVGVEGPLPVPQTIELFQNYPNPFNPTTEIRYQIPEVSRVSLKVYDMLGREVATLFDGTRDPGTYAATFDGSGLAAGIYVCRLNANDVVAVRKLVLVK